MMNKIENFRKAEDAYQLAYDSLNKASCFLLMHEEDDGFGNEPYRAEIMREGIYLKKDMHGDILIPPKHGLTLLKWLADIYGYKLVNSEI